MASAGAIRAGAAYVEISANDAKLKAGLASAKAQMSSFGASLKQIGNTVIGVGIFEGLKSITAGAFNLDAFKNLDDQLKNIQAVANPTADGMKAISDSINSISVKTESGPADVAAVFSELSRAGLDTATIMNGAGQSIIQFAKTGKLNVSEAATTMADALNVFSSEGLKAVEVVNILQSAADESSIGVQQIAQAFSQSSAVFGASNQKMKDLATSIGILGSKGVKGSDAGTSLKTFMVSLLAPSEKAASIISQLGINTRDAAGQMMPMRELISELQTKLGGLDTASRDSALKDIFGTDALRASIILLNTGADGFDRFQNKMDSSLSVAEKFKIIMSSIGNRMNALYSSVQRVGVAIGETLAGPLKSIIDEMTGLGNGLAIIIKNNPEFISQLAKIGAGIVGVTAAIGLGYVAFKAASVGVAAITFAYGAFLIGIKAVLAVLALLPVSVSFIGIAFAASAAVIFAKTDGIKTSLSLVSTSFDDLKKSGMTAFSGIANALKAGDLALAGDIAMAGLNLAFATGLVTAKELWIGFKDWLFTLFDDIKVGAEIKFSEGKSKLGTAFNSPLRTIGANIGFAAWKAANPQISNEKAQEAFDAIFEKGIDPEGYKKKKDDLDKIKIDLANENQEAANKRKEANDLILAPFRKAVEDSKNALNKLADVASEAAKKQSDEDFGRIGLRGGAGSDFTIGKREQEMFDGTIGPRETPREIFKFKVTTQGFFNTSALYGQQIGNSAVTTQMETLKVQKEIKTNTGRTANALENLDFEGAG